jgi:hypothetical protein
MSNNKFFEKYVIGVQGARDALRERKFVRELFSGNASPEQVEMFWIYYSALAVKMTVGVERWIRTAGKSSGDIGYKDLAKTLDGHANAEAGHDKMLVEDTYALVKWRADRGKSKLNPEQLLQMPATQAIQDYIKLHEDVIHGPLAYAQTAIEYMIEQMSAEFGPELVKITEQYVPGLVENLSFVKEHIEVDKKHTDFNEKQMKRFLNEFGDEEKVAQLIKAGAAAITIYGAFFDECWVLAAQASA